MEVQPLTFLTVRTRAGESEALPPLIPLFEEYDGRLSQEELWWYYYNRYRDVLPKNAIPAIMARVYRVYPSLVRERHLYLMLKDRGEFDWVLRDPKLDLAGVDFLIVKDGRAFGVHAYLASERGNAYREIKKARHDIDIGLIVEMPLEPMGGQRIGKFWVYGEDELEGMKAQILMGLKGQN